MISDVRDYYIDNFRFPTLLDTIFPFPSLFLCPKSVETKLFYLINELEKLIDSINRIKDSLW